MKWTFKLESNQQFKPVILDITICAEFRILLNSACKEIRIKLNLDISCCHTVQNRLSCCMLSENINMKMSRAIILTVVCGSKTWFLMLRK